MGLLTGTMSTARALVPEVLEEKTVPAAIGYQGGANYAAVRVGVLHAGLPRMPHACLG